MKIPVVLPIVHVDVDADGVLTVDIDGARRDRTEQHSRRPSSGPRRDHHRPRDRRARRGPRGRRHDVRRHRDPPESPAPAAAEPSPTTANSGARGAGFQPGEEVALAYVVARQTADADGNASLNLPPALLAATRGGLVLLGPQLADSRPDRGGGMNPSARGANDELVNLALIGLVAAFALALVLRAAATVAAVVTGAATPDRRRRERSSGRRPTRATRPSASVHPGSHRSRTGSW